MKGILKKILKFGFAGALSLLAIVPSAAHAEESATTTAVIPITTEFAADSDTPPTTVKLNTYFELEPLDGAPAPEVLKFYIAGAGKAEFGPMTYTVPGNFYYRLTAKLSKGTNNDPIDETYYVRVTVYNSDNGGLANTVTAYRSQTAAEDGKEPAKAPLVSQIKYKAPPAKKAETTKTSVYNQPGLWILVGGFALFILAGAAKRSKTR